MSALETLATLSSDENLVQEYVMPSGIITLLVDIMKQFDW